MEKLVIGHFYPDLLNLYGDRGNVLALMRRASLRGIEVEVRRISIGDEVKNGDIDIGFIGGGFGILLSYGISYVLNNVLGLGSMMYMDGVDISIIPPWLALVSVIFAALIAMLAGFLPSIRAMKLSPLAAIRAE